MHYWCASVKWPKPRRTSSHCLGLFLDPDKVFNLKRSVQSKKYSLCTDTWPSFAKPACVLMWNHNTTVGTFKFTLQKWNCFWFLCGLRLIFLKEGLKCCVIYFNLNGDFYSRYPHIIYSMLFDSQPGLCPWNEVGITESYIYNCYSVDLWPWTTPTIE